MSVRALGAAWRVECEPFHKLVLLALAYRAPDWGVDCCPSLTELSDQTGLSRSTITRILNALESDGAVTRERAPYQPTKYILNIEEWPRIYPRGDRPPTSWNARLGCSAARWAALRKAVFERDGYACQYCGTTCTTLYCDHVVPVSKGGTNALENLVAACRPCNSSKGARTPEEWRARSSTSEVRAWPA